MPRIRGVTCASLLLLVWLMAPAATAAAPEPGPAIDSTDFAFYPERWRELRIEPGRHKLLAGRPTLAAVPDGRLTCGIGCGRIGVTGIEVAGFDRDFALVTKSPAAFPHYYFYEMRRNWYVFGDRHSSFITGYAVFKAADLDAGEILARLPAD